MISGRGKGAAILNDHNTIIAVSGLKCLRRAGNRRVVKG